MKAVTEFDVIAQYEMSRRDCVQTAGNSAAIYCRERIGRLSWLVLKGRKVLSYCVIGDKSGWVPPLQGFLNFMLRLTRQ